MLTRRHAIGGLTGIPLAGLIHGCAEPTVRQMATLFVASSLMPLIERLSNLAECPPILPVYGSSGKLAHQIKAGAPADLFLSADLRWTQWVTQNGLQASTPRVFARNQLALVKAGSKGKPPPPPLRSSDLAALLQRLDRTNVRLALGQPDLVPVGAYAKEAFETLGVTFSKAQLIYAPSSAAVVNLVRRKDVYVGLVYASEAQTSGLETLALFDAALHSPIVYSVIPLSGARSKRLALAFDRFLDGPQARTLLLALGYGLAET